MRKRSRSASHGPQAAAFRRTVRGGVSKFAPGRPGAFTLLELLAAILVSALILAAVAPVLAGALRAHRDAREVLAPLPEEAGAFALLRRDLAEMDPETFYVSEDSAGSSVMGYHLPPTLPSVAGRAHDREKGGVAVRWVVRQAAGRPGLSWVRECTFDLPEDAAAQDAFGLPAFSDEDILAGPLEAVRVEVLFNGSFYVPWGVDPQSTTGAQPSANLPAAVRVAWSRRGAPERTWVIDAPLRSLWAGEAPQGTSPQGGGP